MKPVALGADLRLAPDLQAGALQLKDGKNFVAGGAPPETERMHAVGEQVFAGGSNDFRFALGCRENEAAAHTVAAEDPTCGTAGEEQLFGVDHADKGALLITDDDAGLARIG